MNGDNANTIQQYLGKLQQIIWRGRGIQQTCKITWVFFFSFLHSYSTSLFPPAGRSSLANKHWCIRTRLTNSHWGHTGCLKTKHSLLIFIKHSQKWNQPLHFEQHHDVGIDSSLCPACLRWSRQGRGKWLLNCVRHWKWKRGRLKLILKWIILPNCIECLEVAKL